jgi:hypothetical protein
MKRFFLMTYLILFSFSLQANENFLPLPMIKRGSNFLKLSANDLVISNPISFLKVKVIRGVIWDRTQKNLLLPSIKIRISLKREDVKTHFRYRDISYFPQLGEKDEFTDIEFSLFDTEKINVFLGGKIFGDISVKIKKDRLEKKTILLDHSCNSFDVKVSGFKGEFMSLGCEFDRETVEGDVRSSLKLNWASSDYKTIDDKSGPYTVLFTEGREANVDVVNEAGELKEINFKVDFPAKNFRLNTALGIGPYYYEAKENESLKPLSTLPSFMLYGNYYLNNIHSFKFFNALVAKDSVFNHAGLYIGSEIGRFYDDRLIINTLLGLQILSFKFETEKSQLFNQIIYPQGLEIVMHHPWDLANYKASIGGFISPQSDITYQNFWLRFGAKVFLEFNYINWQFENRSASMYGLSIGFPFFKAF